MLQRLRDALVVRPRDPGPVGAAVEAELAAQARRRARTLAWAGLLVNLPLFYLDEYLAYAGGHWAEQPVYHAGLMAWRVTAVVSLGVYLWLDRRTPHAPAADARLSTGLAVLFSLLGGAFGIWFEVNVPAVPLYAFSLLLVAVLVHPLGVWHLALGYAATVPLMLGGALLYGTAPSVVLDWVEFPLLIVALTTVVDRLLVRGAYRTSRQAHLLQRSNDRLEAALGELRETQGRLVAAERQAERASISRDLHDSVGAQLTHLLAGVELARLQRAHGGDGGPADPLDTLEADARATLRDLRETIWALQTDTLSLAGLERRVSSFAEPIAARAGLALAVERDGDAPLTAAQALHLFRIAQEAVANATRHSGGARVAVRLAAAGGAVELSVSDDGAFRDPPAAAPGAMPTGFGLAGMRDRAAELGGTLDLATDGGTTVTVRVPTATATPASSAAAGQGLNGGGFTDKLSSASSRTDVRDLDTDAPGPSSRMSGRSALG